MLRKILVPIGIAPTLEVDLQYGVKLSLEFSATLTILQTYPITHRAYALGTGTGITPMFPGPDPLIDIEQIKENTEQKIKALTKNKELNYEILVLPGLAHDVLMDQCEMIEPDLIVIGKNLSVGLEKIFGSESEAVSRKVDCPVLVVPENCEFEPIKKMGLALSLDNEVSNLRDQKLLFSLLRNSSASLEIVSNLDSEKKPSQKYEILNKAVKKLLYANEVVNFSFHTFFEEEAKDGILKFIDQRAIDLLVLIYREHKIFERIFNSGTRAQMIEESKIPLLILK